MKTDLRKILAVSGYPGLFRFLSQSKNGMVVESLIDGKRMNAGTSLRITGLSDMAVYTDTEELPLMEVLAKIKEKLHGAAAINHKSEQEVLKKFFEEVLPSYDRERFYPSHMKKVIEWYNILQKNNMLDFLDEKESEEDKKEE